MKDWFDNLEARERLFVLGGGLFAVVALIYGLLWVPLDKNHAQLVQSVSNWERSLAELRPLSSLASSSTRRPGAARG